MSGDPLIYKLLALGQILVWGTFLVRYSLRLGQNRRRNVERAFAYALLTIAVAMVLYGIATVLRQFLGLDYFGRDLVRIAAALGILSAGIVFHRALTKWPSDNGERRRKADRRH